MDKENTTLINGAGDSKAIAERIEWKHDLYRKIAPHLGANTILASNTSGIPIHSLAEALPEAVLACRLHALRHGPGHLSEHDPLAPPRPLMERPVTPWSWALGLRWTGETLRVATRRRPLRPDDRRAGPCRPTAHRATTAPTRNFRSPR